MTNEQKNDLQFGLEYAHAQLVALEASEYSLWTKHESAQHQLMMLLEDIIPALPRAFRVQAQECYARYARIRDAWYAEASSYPHDEQQKASPECLAAVDSL